MGSEAASSPPVSEGDMSTMGQTPPSIGASSADASQDSGYTSDGVKMDNRTLAQQGIGGLKAQSLLDRLKLLLPAKQDDQGQPQSQSQLGAQAIMDFTKSLNQYQQQRQRAAQQYYNY